MLRLIEELYPICRSITGGMARLWVLNLGRRPAFAARHGRALRYALDQLRAAADALLAKDLLAAAPPQDFSARAQD